MSVFWVCLAVLFRYLKHCLYLEWCVGINVTLSRLYPLGWATDFHGNYRVILKSRKILRFKCISHWLFLCFSVSKNPFLHLKHATVKNKKKNRKKPAASPVKKNQSPVKSKLIGSPAKNLPATSGSPQKLIDGFLKQEGTAAQVTLTLTTFGKAVPVSLDLVHPACFLCWVPY